MFQQIVKLTGACCTVIGGVLSSFGITLHSVPLQVSGACVAGIGGVMSAFSPHLLDGGK